MSEDKQKEQENKKLAKIAPQAIVSNTKIAALAMKGAAPAQKIGIYCCYGVILLGIIVLAVPPYQASKQIIALALTVACLVIVGIFVLARYKNLSSGSESRPTLPLQLFPLSNLKRDHLRTMLEETRNIALQFLESKNQMVWDDLVRADIFFPEYDSPPNTNQYKLKICPGLHLKMNYPPELSISFLPNQGATGNVFASGQPRVAQRLTSGKGDWDDFFNITDELAATIHSELKWIISMPLLLTGGKPMGVVNVDGLQYQFPIDTLYECMGKLTTNVVVMSSVLASH
jgi:hypothetical protein